MAMDVAIPSSLLEDIFRLLDYLDKRCDHDDLHFHKSGYSRRFEHDNALWELRFKINQLQNGVVETYLLSVGNITDDEKRELREWVALGNSVYDNPYSLCDESGRPMDFINGCRIGIQTTGDPSCFTEIGPDDNGNADWGDEPPF